MLGFIHAYLPANFKLTLNRVIDQYPNQQHFEAELEENINKLTSIRQKEPISLTPQQINMINLNVYLPSKSTLNLNRQQKIQIIHDAYSLATKRRPYYRNPNKIMVNNTSIPGAIGIGTTKTSVTKFWTGVGVLEKRDDSYIERIFSPQQLEQAQKLPHKTIKVDLIDLKNFKTIDIYDQPFNFTKRTLLSP